MSRLARYLLCAVLLLMTLVGSPTTTTAQSEVPPLPANSEMDIRETESMVGMSADLIQITNEAAGAEFGRTAEEIDSVNAFRRENPALLATAPEYYSIAGTAFQPRSSSVKANATRGGCVYRSGEGGSDDNNSFTAHVNLPDGAVILGVRLFGYDDSTKDMALHLFQFNGAGGITNSLGLTSANATPGYFTTYAPLNSFITVNNASNAISLVWYPYAPSSRLLLCGARIFFYQPFPPVFSAKEPGAGEALPQGIDSNPQLLARRSFTAFIAGQDFHPRNSDSGYSYGGAGCIIANKTDYFVSDVDLPEGALLRGARLLYYDTNRDKDTGLFITTYNGSGSSTDILHFTNGQAMAGYGKTYVALPAPHGISQFNESMVVQVTLPTSTTLETVKLCGVQLLWEKQVGYGPSSNAVGSPGSDLPLADSTSTSPALPRLLAEEYHYRFIAGSAFHPQTADGMMMYDSAGCVHMTSGVSLTADLQLPLGTKIYGVRFYTYDVSAGISHLVAAEYNMQGKYTEFLTGSNSDATPYASIYLQLPTAYTANASNAYALVWNSGSIMDPNMRLCGMRVYYSFDQNLKGIYLPLLRR